MEGSRRWYAVSGLRDSASVWISSFFLYSLLRYHERHIAMSIVPFAFFVYRTAQFLRHTLRWRSFEASSS